MADVDLVDGGDLVDGLQRQIPELKAGLRQLEDSLARLQRGGEIPVLTSPIRGQLASWAEYLGDAVSQLNSVLQSLNSPASIASAELPITAPERRESGPEKPLIGIEFPFEAVARVRWGGMGPGGIIRHLLNKEGRTPWSMLLDPGSRLADVLADDREILCLRIDPADLEKDRPGQWVCYDFRESRVRPTGYEVYTKFLRSWVIEGSLDGENWTELDRQTNNMDCKEQWTYASFPISDPVECRFVRLTQTGTNHAGANWLNVGDIEVFGTLFE
jgi:hypothetical protein